MMQMGKWRRAIVATGIGLAVCARPASAHSGPPYPIVSTQTFGPYQVSVWTDPDTTDDRTPAGRFWVTVKPAHVDAAPPPETRVHVAIAPTDRDGATIEGDAATIDHDATQHLVALLMDHEGPFRVHVSIDGPLGHADIDSHVDATYDLRPAPMLMFVFAMPFVLVGFLWIKLLLRRRTRRMATRPGANDAASS
jgi:hypothetical protein